MNMNLILDKILQVLLFAAFGLLCYGVGKTIGMLENMEERIEMLEMSEIHRNIRER